jgi:hypothetical protein
VTLRCDEVEEGAMRLYKYMDPSSAKRFIDTKQLRFTPPINLNDPFEYRPYLRDDGSGGGKSAGDLTLNDDRWGVLRVFLKRISERIGICCFSSDPTAPLMWSHYSAGHTGAAICFDGTHPFFSSNHLVRVMYSDARPVLSVAELRDGGFKVVGDWPGWREFVSRRLDIIGTKAKCWSYESEIRLVKEYNPIKEPNSIDELGCSIEELFTVPQSAIVAIILGARMQHRHSREFGLDDFGFEEEIRYRLQQDASLSHVGVLRAHAEFERFQIALYDPMSFREAARFLHPQQLHEYQTGMRGPLSASTMESIRARRNG